MIILQEDDLKLIKQLELEICKEIRAICDRNDIQYSIAFGTLLGAIRHGGFIPWDDDIDIAMLRSEYDKFLNCADKELDERFEIVNYEHNDNVGEPFTKIILKDTIMLERFAEFANAPCGVFVDIIPYNAAPDNWIKKTIHRFLNYELRKRILISSNYNFQKTGLKKLIYGLLKAISHNKKSLVKQYRKNEKRYNNSDTQEVVALGGNYGYIKDTIPKEWLMEYKKVIFEDEEFSAFAKTDEFLRHYYGDYMKLPPENMRVNKHTVAKLDLSHYGGRCS